MKINIINKNFLILSFTATIAIFLLCITAGIIRHNYWSYIVYSNSPFDYFQSLLLLASTLLAFKNLHLLYRKYKKVNIAWFFLSFGFLYLTVDERFGIHRIVREKYFKPNDINIDSLFWVEKGDYILIIVFMIALFLLPIFLRELIKIKKSFIYFSIGFILGACAILTDSFELSPFAHSLQKQIQILEEIFETGAILFFLNSFFVAFNYNKTLS